MGKVPKGSVLNTGNALASGLIGAFLMSEAGGTVVGDQGTRNASEGTLSGTVLPRWAGVADQGLLFGGGAVLNSYVTFGAPSALNNLFGVTGALLPGSIYIRGRMGATNTAGGLVGKNDDNATTQGWQILLGAGPTIQFTNEATANFTATIVAPAANTDFDLGIGYDGTLPGALSNIDMMLNGVAVTETLAAAGNTPKTTDAASALRFGTTTGFSAAGSFDGYLYLVLIWNRRLSAAEWAAVNQDPYQVFAAALGFAGSRALPNIGPRDKRGFVSRQMYSSTVVVAAGGAVTVLPDVGSIQLDGFAPTIGLPVTVTPDVGQIIVTGFAPSVVLPTTVAPGLGQMTISGFAPTIGLPVTVLPGLGQISISGFAPVIGLPVTVRPDVGQMVITGYEPTVTTSGAVTVLPDVGEMVVTGFEPTVSTGEVAIPVPVGAGSSSGRAGLELYASMRAAEARRLGESKPIASPAAEGEPLVSIPVVVERPKRVEAVEPVELEPAGKQAGITALQLAMPAEALDLGPSLLPEMEVPASELYPDSALDGIRARQEAAHQKELAVESARLRLFDPREKKVVRQVSPVAHAAQLAAAQRRAIEEEELAYVLLIAA